MFSRMGSHWRRLKVIFYREPKNRPTLDAAIQEVIDARGDMLELADKLCMTPLELYRAAQSDRLKGNIRVRLPVEYQNEIRRSIHEDIFGKAP